MRPLKLPLFKLASLSALGFALSSVVAGCVADADTDEGDQAASQDALHYRALAPGEFKLYAKARATPNPSCDVHTALTLTSARGARANLREVVDGSCEIYVDPDPREYRLYFAGTSCGSQIFRGRTLVAGKSREIKITDHRTRICRDIVPAQIIVEETDATGAEQRTYSLDPRPEATSTWLTISPRQCGTNPWSGVQPAAGQQASYLSGEAGEVDNFFRAKGIHLEQVGFAHPAEPMMVCMACSCPRGDTLIVHAKSSADAQVLVSQYGFAPMQHALSRSPTQCGTNPWENGQPSGTDESRQLSSWAASAGAPLEAAAFVEYTEPRMVCMACQCPRGDIAVAFPKDVTSANKLENLGWTRVEN